MALRAVIFDLDGTLIDSNWAHVEAWRRAFAAHGHGVPADRIIPHIGKGGDKLVPDILGPEVEAKDGDRLRDTSAAAFLEIAGSTSFKVFPKVPELLTELRTRGLRLALATSSGQKHLAAIYRSAGIDLGPLVDAVVNADDAKATKPSPDLVTAALSKLDVGTTEAVMVGDTRYDAEACRNAGVACIGLLSGGLGVTAATLRQAGACGVWKDVADLLAHLDEALAVAARATAPP